MISLRHILRTALSGTIATFVYLYFYVDNSYWIVISAIFVMQGEEKHGFTNILCLATDRFIATGLGIFFGLIGHMGMLMSVTDGFKESILIIVFVILALTDACQQLCRSLQLTTITASIIMLISIRSDIAIELAVMRAQDIATGVLIGITMGILIPASKKASSSYSPSN